MKKTCEFFCGIKCFLNAFPLLLLFSLLLSACGSDSSSPQVDAQPAAVAGIAAAGAPLAGKVHLSDSSFKTYSSNSQINRDGSFSIDTTGMTAPFILRADDKDGNALYYSFAKEPGIFHINPLTDLALTVAALKAGRLSPADLFANHTTSDMNAVAGAITGAVSNIMDSLNPLLSLYRANDPLSGSYQVNGQGLDGLFDDVAFTVSGGMVTIARKDTNTTVFSSALSDLISAPYSAGLDTNNLPTPRWYPTPGNAELTLKVQGNLPQGTLIKNVSFSVQLPLGISVDLDPPQPKRSKGFKAAVNTAVPILSATGSNVYPAPELSPVNNILTVTMSSVAGFEVGDFVKIRCIASSSSIMDSTTPDSFTVTSSSIYSDIYNNQKLKDLTIVPVAFIELPRVPPPILIDGDNPTRHQ
jgi:hypothetical protein